MASAEEKRVLSVSFNQDNTCVALGTTSGILIYNLELHRCIYTYNIGAIRTVQMLFCTSLVAYVGAGLQPALTPRKLTLLNTATSEAIQDISFPSVVLAVLMNRSRLVAVLEQQVCVYALQSLAHLFSIDTPGNRRGLAALSACEQPCLLALPSGPANTGTLRVYNLLAAGESASPGTASPRPTTPGTLTAVGAQGDGGAAVLCELSAHSAPLAALAWYPDGGLIATASTKGTVIRVHRLPAGKCIAEFRRGTVPASIHALAWSPPHIQPPLLAASSSRGSIHLYRLDEEITARGTAGPRSGVTAGLLSAVMRLAPGNPVAAPQTSIATFRLPVDNSVPVALGLLPRAPRASSGTGRGSRPSSSRAPSQPQSRAHSLTLTDRDAAQAMESGAAGTGAGVAGGEGSQGMGAAGKGADDGAGDAAQTTEPSYDADSVTLVVAAADGLLYQYSVTQLHGTHGLEAPTVTLEQEFSTGEGLL